jgi:hypothetical protein
MRLLINIVLFAIVSSTYGQTYPDIEVDRSFKTSEFYVDEYRINSGLGGGYWKLDSDYKLRFGETDDTPPNPGSKVIGKWSLYADTLIFKIEKRTIYDDRINPVKERPNIIKFKTVTFKWTTKTNSKTENNHPISLTTFCTVLLNKEVDTIQLENELLKTINDNLKEDKTYDDLHWVLQIERIEQINEIIRKFFYEKKLFYGTKTYSNGNLIKYP